MCTLTLNHQPGYLDLLLYIPGVANLTAASISQILSDRTASLRLLEEYSPETLEAFQAPLRFTEDSSSESRGGQSPEKKAHKGWGTKLTGPAATKRRGGAAPQKARGARRGTSWHVDLALAQAGVSRQEYESMMVAEGVSPEDLLAAESQFEDLVQNKSNVQMGKGRGLSPSERSACVRLANKMSELSETDSLPAAVDLAGKLSTGSTGACIEAAAGSNPVECFAHCGGGTEGDPQSKDKLPDPDVACLGGSCERPAAASDRIGRALYEWMRAEPQRSRPRVQQTEQASDSSPPNPPYRYEPILLGCASISLRLMFCLISRSCCC